MMDTFMRLGLMFAFLLCMPAYILAEDSESSHHIEIDVIQFVPNTITIKLGDTVVWNNSSSLVHTVTNDPSKATIKGSAELPKTAKPFNSGNINPGEVFAHKFTVPGVYKYFCIPHEGAKMRGQVVVH